MNTLKVNNYHIVIKGNKIKGYAREDSKDFFTTISGKNFRFNIEQIIENPDLINRLIPIQDQIIVGFYDTLEEAIINLKKDNVKPYTRRVSKEDNKVIRQFFATIRIFEKEEYNMPYAIAGFVWEMSGMVVLRNGQMKVSPLFQTKIHPVQLDEYTFISAKKIVQHWELMHRDVKLAESLMEKKCLKN